MSPGLPPAWSPPGPVDGAVGLLPSQAGPRRVSWARAKTRRQWPGEVRDRGAARTEPPRPPPPQPARPVTLPRRLARTMPFFCSTNVDPFTRLDTTATPRPRDTAAGLGLRAPSPGAAAAAAVPMPPARPRACACAPRPMGGQRSAGAGGGAGIRGAVRAGNTQTGGRGAGVGRGRTNALCWEPRWAGNGAGAEAGPGLLWVGPAKTGSGFATRLGGDALTRGLRGHWRQWRDPELCRPGLGPGAAPGMARSPGNEAGSSLAA